MKKMTKILLKGKLFISIILLITALPGMVKAQNTPVIYQNWKMIGESATMIEVSARVLKCDSQSPTQVHLEIFNESSDDQVAHFNLTLTNPLTNAQEIHEISLAVLKAAIVKPDCGNSYYPSLRFNIPAGWDPATVQFALTFIP